MRHALGIPSGRPRLLALAAAVAAAGLLAAGCSSTFDSAPTLTTSSPVPGAAAVWTYRGAGTAECADPFGSGIYPLTVDLTAPAGTSFPAGASDYVLTDVDSTAAGPERETEVAWAAWSYTAGPLRWTSPDRKSVV